MTAFFGSDFADPNDPAADRVFRSVHRQDFNLVSIGEWRPDFDPEPPPTNVNRMARVSNLAPFRSGKHGHGCSV